MRGLTTWADDGVGVVLGDARRVLPQLELDPARTVIITDPVWPNAPEGLFGVEDPAALFLEVAGLFPRAARRAVVQLGCTSDPRILSGMPAALPFVRVCWLRYAVPSYLGTVLGSGDVAYVFGSHEPPAGRKLLGGECTSNHPTGREVLWHPTPRKLEHVRWLVEQCTRPDDLVLDPFAGSGTTLLAAREAGRRTLGIEQDPAFVDGIRRRVSEQRRLFAAGGAS